MNIEEANRLGNRHLVGNDKFLLNPVGNGQRVVRLTASESVAASTAGQHCLWMLTNLLARQFGVISSLVIDVPPATPIGTIFQFGSGTTLKEALLDTARLVAGTGLDICDNPGRRPIDAEAGVGQYQPQAQASVAVVADGWKIFAGSTSAIPSVVPISDNPFGPYFAACIAAGEVFKHLAGLRPGYGRFLNDFTCSLWDYKSNLSWETADVGSWPERIELAPFYLVGAGAVGQAVVASLAASPRISGYATAIDNEAIDDTNRNRYVLAHAENVDHAKVAVVSRALSRSNFQLTPYRGAWEAYVQGTDRPSQRADVRQLEHAWKFQRILSCVDKNHARHSIQNVWPELIIGGSTFECGILVQAYDLRTDGECLKCSNPIEEAGPTLEGEAARWRQMSPSLRKRIAAEKALNIEAIETYLDEPKCGILGEKEIAKFLISSSHDWSVGFVSVAAGVLLAAKFVQAEIAEFDTAFPPSKGQALRFSFLNPGPVITRHQRKDACNCSTSGKSSFLRLWTDNTPRH